MDDRITNLRKLACDLPKSPGVYIMYNEKGNIIYVGKSKALHNRVSSYFVSTGHKDYKTSKMVSNVHHFEYILTETEIEALNLENNLIKLHKPKYNILLKDDKSYPYIKVTVADEYPRVEFTRKRLDDKAKYFGPYSGAGVANSLIKTIQKTFSLPRCAKHFPRDIGKERPCMYRQLGQCMAPCEGKIVSEEYKKTIDDVVSFLRGSLGDVKESLLKKMQYASDNMLYEIAAKYRDSISELDRIWDRQHVVGNPNSEYDVISEWSDEASECIAVLYIRSGAVSDSEKFVFGADSILDDEAVVSFLCELYNKREYIPKNILLGFDISEDNVKFLEEYLSDKNKTKVNVSIPKRGDLKSLCDMASKNAMQYAKEYRTAYERDSKMLIKMASMLSLEVVPENIEAYDISNFGSDNITGGMISVTDAKFNKKGYRTYKMRTVDSPDDYSSMRETLQRRLSHTEMKYPDLILLDGGKGHVSVIKDLLSEMNIDIPVFGMVKDSYHKTRALVDENDEISIAREQSVFQFVYKIQEEVHRYTIGQMSRAKSKTLTHSSLEKIDGIGQKKAKLLLSSFGTIGALKEANEEDIKKIKGISEQNAKDIYNYFHKENK